MSTNFDLFFSFYFRRHYQLRQQNRTKLNHAQIHSEFYIYTAKFLFNYLFNRDAALLYNNKMRFKATRLTLFHASHSLSLSPSVSVFVMDKLIYFAEDFGYEYVLGLPFNI